MLTTSNEVAAQVEAAKAKNAEARKPVGEEIKVVKPKFTPEAPQSGTSAIAYLEQKCSEQAVVISKLQHILSLYRDHVGAMAELTAAVFAEPEPEEPTDA